MWVSLVVPLVLLVATLLLQRLEAALLTGIEPADRQVEDPAARDVVGPPAPTTDPPQLALVRDPPSRRPRPSTVRATA